MKNYFMGSGMERRLGNTVVRRGADICSVVLKETMTRVYND